MKFGFIMDPIENVNIDADTTFAFMLAAKEAGHEVYYLEMQDLSARGAQAFGIWQSCDVRREKGNHYTLSEPEFGSLDTFDVLFMRKDPPFDIAYLHACHLLELAEERGVLVVNKPSGLRAANEKLYALHFREVMPETTVDSDKARIKAFVDRGGGRDLPRKVQKVHHGCDFEDLISDWIQVEYLRQTDADQHQKHDKTDRDAKHVGDRACEPIVCAGGHQHQVVGPRRD